MRGYLIDLDSRAIGPVMPLLARPHVDTTAEIAGGASAAQAADWPRLAGAWGSLRRDLAHAERLTLNPILTLTLTLSLQGAPYVYIWICLHTYICVRMHIYMRMYAYICT